MTAQHSVFTCYFAFYLGVVTHITYFNRGAHHTRGKKYLQTLLFSPLIPTLIIHYSTSTPWFQAFFTGLSLLSSFLCGIFFSLLAYRFFLHPLHTFPGPRLARFSDLWLSVQLRRHDMHKLSVELMEKHGPFVRIGPSTLMLTHPLAVPALHGVDSKCTKASMYDFEQPNRGIATLDRAVHDKRRRVWSRGFGDKSLRGYETRIHVFIEQLLDRLSCAQKNAQPVDATLETLHFSFDVMGDLGLGQAFGMLQHGRRHPAVAQLIQGMEIMGLRLPTWLLRLIVDVAQSLVPTEASTGFLSFCYDKLDVLMKDAKRFERPTLMASLLAHYESLPEAERDLSVVRNDCRFIIIAGSDTVAATLAFIFFYLARYPEHVEKLRAELALLDNSDGFFNHRDLQNCAHFNAVIDETLRLHPPASTIMRQTPPGGIKVAGVHIPGDITVFSSQYAIGRSEAAYEAAAEFIPERWTTRPDMVKDGRGFAPFSMGKVFCFFILILLSCLGKHVFLLIQPFLS